MLAPSRLMATARIIPLPIVGRIADFLLKEVLSIHPKLFDRLGEYSQSRFAFVPSDFPFSFLICPKDRTVQAFRRGTHMVADTTICGPLVLMLALAEGRIDGDAIFFARKLTVTGDMEAVLALRNALDDNEIDLVDAVGRLSGPLTRSITGALGSVRRQALKAHGVQWS